MLHFTVALNAAPCLWSGEARGAELGQWYRTEPRTRRSQRRPRMLFGPVPGSSQRLPRSHRALETAATPPCVREPGGGTPACEEEDGGRRAHPAGAWILLCRRPGRARESTPTHPPRYCQDPALRPAARRASCVAAAGTGGVGLSALGIRLDLGGGFRFFLLLLFLLLYDDDSLARFGSC